MLAQTRAKSSPPTIRKSLARRIAVLVAIVAIATAALTLRHGSSAKKLDNSGSNLDRSAELGAVNRSVNREINGTKASAAAENKRSSVLTVTTQYPAVQLIERELAVNGSISAWDPVSVGATTSGLETKTVLVEEGDCVKKGQVLATLDSSQIRPQLKSEQSKLRADLNNLKKAIQPNRPEDIAALTAVVLQAEANVADQQAALLQAEANLENAIDNVNRYRYLQSQGASSKQELEMRETTVKVNEATVRSARQKVKATQFALEQAQQKLAMAKLGGREEDVEIAHSNVAQTRSNIERLQAQLNQTIITAPVAGQVARRDVHIGDISTSGKTMFLLTRDNRLEVKAQVPEADLYLVHPGQAVTIKALPASTKTIQGRVREISPLVSSDTRLATVRIDLPSGSELRAGMYAEGHIKVGKHRGLAIPSSAVVNRDDRNIVFVLENQTACSRQVGVGARMGDLVEIQSGLCEKDPIIIKGAGFLKDGDYVMLSN